MTSPSRLKSSHWDNTGLAARSAGSAEVLDRTPDSATTGPARAGGGASVSALAGLSVPGGNLAGQNFPSRRARGHGLPARNPRGRIQHRADDPALRPATAQMAVEGLAHLLLGRGWVLAQQADRGDHHAGGAIAALSGLLLNERLLHRVQALAVRQPLHGIASGLAAAS